MSENTPSHATPDAAPSEDMSWIERARHMAEYHPDALDFIRRASAHFPVAAHHVRLLLRLWIEADRLDGLILPLLNEMNVELLCGHGELETTRGVSTQPSALGALTDGDAEEVVYECIWSLSDATGFTVSVVLSVNEDGVFGAQARGGASAFEQRLGYPVAATAVQDALVAVYVAEITSI